MSVPRTFFDHQEIAKRRTGWALTGFFATVVLTSAAVALFGGFVSRLVFYDEFDMPPDDLFRGAALIWGLVTLFAILLSSFLRHLELRAGPDRVMKSMDGARIDPQSTAEDERRLLNLVEEMSLASGVPVPDVYLLDSAAINACAYGLDTEKAALGVTRGAVVKLSRDELQGVIAHEYSHILHGDMALNTRLIAWLAGLFTITELGRGLCYAGVGGDDDGMFQSRDRGGHVLLLVIGAVVWTLGSIGHGFGKLLQAAISRQREFLADASAVQYTRNPDGLADALRKLGRKSVGARMTRPRTDCAHMMFANLRSTAPGGLASTHPPLPERIRRIQPRWDGTYLDTIELHLHTPEPVRQTAPQPRLLRDIPPPAALLNLMEHSGLPDAQRLEAARAWRNRLPQELLDAARDPESARALVYLLLTGDAPAEAAARVRESLSLIHI